MIGLEQAENNGAPLLCERVERHARLLDSRSALRIPVSVFATELSPAEALVKYLREQEKMRYADIARLLNRDQRGIWCTYRRACRKRPEQSGCAACAHSIPAWLFSERKLSILEHVVRHLRGQNHTLKAIAQLTCKSASTIATVHHRARRKLE